MNIHEFAVLTLYQVNFSASLSMQGVRDFLRDCRYKNNAVLYLIQTMPHQFLIILRKLPATAVKVYHVVSI